MVCPRCKSTNDPYARICNSCGFIIENTRQLPFNASSQAGISNSTQCNPKTASGNTPAANNPQTTKGNGSFWIIAIVIIGLFLLHSNYKGGDKASSSADTVNKSISSNSSTSNSNTSQTGIAVIKDFDYSNRYTHAVYTPHEQSNTGDAVIDFARNISNNAIDEAWKSLYETENMIKDALTVNWGFIPQKLFYYDGNIRVDGVFYNNNRYSTITNISDLKISLIDADGQIVFMQDYSGNQELSKLQLPFSQNVPISFLLPNAPAQLDLTKYTCIINSDFTSIPDEEKLQREKPELYSQAKARQQYYMQEAEKYRQKSKELADDYINRVNRYSKERAIDAASY